MRTSFRVRWLKHGWHNHVRVLPPSYVLSSCSCDHCEVRINAMLHRFEFRCCTEGYANRPAPTKNHSDVCLTMSPAFPVCLPVFPPSTTSRSSWKNWLMTVWRYSRYQCLARMVCDVSPHLAWSPGKRSIYPYLHNLQLLLPLLHQLMSLLLRQGLSMVLPKRISRTPFGVFSEVVGGEVVGLAEERSILREAL